MQEVELRISVNEKHEYAMVNVDFLHKEKKMDVEKLAVNDGFVKGIELKEWFYRGNYMNGKMAILQFTSFKY